MQFSTYHPEVMNTYNLSMSTANGGSLEDCATNQYALTEFTGLKWQAFESPTRGGLTVQPKRFLEHDLIISAYCKLQKQRVLCTWRRVTANELPDKFTPPSLYLGAPKELWVFWWSSSEPENLDQITKALVKKKNDDETEDGTPASIPYDVRTLLNKAWHTLFENVYRKHGFFRIGRWFYKPPKTFDPNTVDMIDDYHIAYSHAYNVMGGSSLHTSIVTQMQPTLIQLNHFHIERNERFKRKTVQVILAPWSFEARLLLRYPIVAKGEKQEAQLTYEWDQWKKAYKIEDPKKRKKKLDDDNGSREGDDKMPLMVRVEVLGNVYWWPSKYTFVTLEETRNMVKERYRIMKSLKHLPAKQTLSRRNRFTRLTSGEGILRATQSAIDDIEVNKKMKNPEMKCIRTPNCGCSSCSSRNRPLSPHSFIDYLECKGVVPSTVEDNRMDIDNMDHTVVNERLNIPKENEKYRLSLKDKKNYRKVMMAQRYNWRKTDGKPMTRKEAQYWREDTSGTSGSDDEDDDDDVFNVIEKRKDKKKVEKIKEEGSKINKWLDDNNQTFIYEKLSIPDTEEASKYHLSSFGDSPRSINGGPSSDEDAPPLSPFTPYGVLSPCDPREVENMGSEIKVLVQLEHLPVNESLGPREILSEYGSFYDPFTSLPPQQYQSYHSRRRGPRAPQSYDEYMAKQKANGLAYLDHDSDDSDNDEYGIRKNKNGRNKTPTPSPQSVPTPVILEMEMVGGMKTPPIIDSRPDKLIVAKNDKNGNPKPIWPSIDINDEYRDDVMDGKDMMFMKTDIGSDEEIPIHEQEELIIDDVDDAGEGTSSDRENWRDEMINGDDYIDMIQSTNITYSNPSGYSSMLMDTDDNALHSDSVLSPPASNERADSNNSIYHRLGCGPHSAGDQALNKIYPTPPSVLQLDICSPAAIGGPHSQARKDENAHDEDGSSSSVSSSMDEDIERSIDISNNSIPVKDNEPIRGDTHITSLVDSLLRGGKFADKLHKTNVPYCVRFAQSFDRQRVKSKRSMPKYSRKDNKINQEEVKKRNEILTAVENHSSARSTSKQSSTTTSNNTPMNSTVPSHLLIGSSSQSLQSQHMISSNPSSSHYSLLNQQPSTSSSSLPYPPSSFHPSYQSSHPSLTPLQMPPRPIHPPPYQSMHPMQQGGGMMGPPQPGSFIPGQVPQPGMIMNQYNGQGMRMGIHPQTGLPMGQPSQYPSGYPISNPSIQPSHPMHMQHMYPQSMHPQMMYQRGGMGMAPPPQPYGVPSQMGNVPSTQGGIQQGHSMMTMNMGGGMMIPSQSSIIHPSSINNMMTIGAPGASTNPITVAPTPVVPSSSSSTYGIRSPRKPHRAPNLPGPSPIRKKKRKVIRRIIRIKKTMKKSRRIRLKGKNRSEINNPIYDGQPWKNKKLKKKDLTEKERTAIIIRKLVRKMKRRGRRIQSDLSVLNRRPGGRDGLSIVIAIMLQDTILDLHFDWVFDSCPLCACFTSIKSRDFGVYISPPPILTLDKEIQNDWIGPWNGLHSDSHNTTKCSCAFSSIRHRQLSMRCGLFLEDGREATGDNSSSLLPSGTTGQVNHYLWYDPTNRCDREMLECLRTLALTDNIGSFINNITHSSRITSYTDKKSLKVGGVGSRNSEYILSEMDKKELSIMGKSIVSIASISTKRQKKWPNTPRYFHPWGMQIANEIAEPPEMEVRSLLDEIKPMIEEAMRDARKITPSAQLGNIIEGPLTWRSLSTKNVKNSGSIDDDSFLAEPIPAINIATDKEAIRIAPTAIRQWEHLGLAPFDQQKDVFYLAVVPDDDRIVDSVTVYMRKLSKVYESGMKFGRHIPILREPAKEGVIRAKRLMTSRNLSPSMDFLEHVDRFGVGCNPSFMTQLRAYVSGIEDTLSNFLGDQNCPIYERNYFRECLAYTLLARKHYKMSKSSGLAKHEKDDDEGQPPSSSMDTMEGGTESIDNQSINSNSALAAALGIPAQSTSSQYDRMNGMDQSNHSSSINQSINHRRRSNDKITKPYGQLRAFVPSKLAEKINWEDLPEDEQGTLPQVIVIYLTNWCAFGHRGREGEASRVATIAIIKAYNSVLNRLVLPRRVMIQLELLPMQRVEEAVGNGMDLDRLDRSSNLNTWQITSALRNAEIYCHDRSRIEDVLRDISLGIYQKPRVLSSDILKNMLPKSMTKFGPASSLMESINEVMKGDPNIAYHRLNMSAYHLSPPPLITPKSDTKLCQCSREEQTLFVSYCLVGTEFIVAACTDSLGKLCDNSIISIRPKNSESSVRHRCKAKSTVREGLDRLWKYIQGVMTYEVKSWRLVIGKLGRMGHGEFKVWSALLSKTNLKKYSSRLKDSCPSCSSSSSPILLSACLISTEAEPNLQVLPSYCTPIDNNGGVKKNRPLHTPGDCTTTHIMVFPTSADIQLVQPTDAGGDDIDEDFDLDMGGMEFDGTDGMNDIISELMVGEGEQLNAASRNGHLNSYFEYALETGVSNQPLASGWLISTAPGGDLPDWFWSSCPSLKRRLPVHLRSSLHINEPQLQRSDDVLQNRKEKEQDISHALDSLKTDEVLRYVLEQYNHLSWLVMDSVTQERRSCLPLHIQALIRLHDTVLNLVM